MPIIAEIALMKKDIEDLTFELQDARKANMILRDLLDKSKDKTEELQQTIDKLETERGEARQQVTDLEYAMLTGEPIVSRDTEIEQLKRDGERLDAMIKHHLVCERTFSGWYRVNRLHEDGYVTEVTNDPNPRKAIDTAMAALEGK